MNIVRALPLIIIMSMPGIALADSAFQSLEFGKNKQQLVRDTKEKCQPEKKVSDDDWANKILLSKDNKDLIRNAKTALEKNNNRDYEKAIGQIKCPQL
ncbi:YicS family protein [Rahnella bruchi]|uniref:YicS family protein n=1 Tax=Rahnella bruchi TaxID=1510573 RepID=UPI001FC95726|nr:YicS family protein [Rahnella bruchi]